MKVAFVSNFLNHHQLSLCTELRKRCEQFWFIATEEIPEERQKLGYADMSGKDFVVRYNENDSERNRAESIIKDSDIVIFGSCPSSLIELRGKEKKISFIYTERLFKKGTWRRIIPTTRKKLSERFLKYNEKLLYILCASAYASRDISFFNKELNYLKWGYFPEFIEQDMESLLKKKEIRLRVKLLWVGRFLGWKHPNDVIEAVYRLTQEGYDFTLDIIGTGESEEALKRLIKKYGLSDRVQLLGSMKPEKVREYMEAANIYLFTSDFNEGWGVVLNEAMNSGCAIVASHAIGSVPYLLSHEKNGLIYEYGNKNDFYKKIKYLLDNPEKQKEFGKAAYLTLHDSWNAATAAERFIHLAENILSAGEMNIYSEGICSRAGVFKNNWFKG